MRTVDMKNDNDYWTQITQSTEDAIRANKPVSFVIFTCSTIQSEYMFSETPWLYVDTDTDGNNLMPDLLQLTKIVSSLRTIYPTEITILIGNTDPYYIYLQQFKNYPNKEVTWKEFMVRWNTYKQNLSAWLVQTYPSLGANVVSWYEFEKEIEKEKQVSFEKQYEQILSDIDIYVDARSLNWELSQLQTQFGKGKYFEKLPAPNETILKDWIRRKFAEYAVQGKWIYEYLPESILIQNEKPSDLRSKMYQPLTQTTYNTSLPIVYFFGVDINGYQ